MSLHVQIETATMWDESFGGEEVGVAGRRAEGTNVTLKTSTHYLLTGVWPYTQPQSQASEWWSR